MQWLIANMWIAMAAATVLGLLFGFAFRGLLVGNRVQKAEVEREIAKTELTQSKAEVEALYAAQRKQKEEAAETVGGGDVLVAALDERERRITALSEELDAARTELEEARSNTQNGNALETAGAAVAGAVAGALLSDGDQEELVQLRDRNTWLEERVGALEIDLANQSAANIDEETPSLAAPAALDSDASGPDEKLLWQSSYLRMRVDALEAKLIDQAAIKPEEEAAEEVEAVAVPDVDPEPDPEPVSEAPASSELDEELAQLRWRNRYLEGRLAYFEQAPEEAVAEPETMESELVEAEDAVEDSQIEPSESEATEEEVEPESASISTDETDSEPVEETETPVPAATADEPEIHPSEAMLAELDGKQPIQVDRPTNGGDDLTTITGVGPRIAEVLNGLGIWTFAQIAEWKPENETWIENHLSFKGRVSRENWVGQAKELLVAA